jgi:hypothetical protein
MYYATLVLLGLVNDFKTWYTDYIAVNEFMYSKIILHQVNNKTT